MIGPLPQSERGAQRAKARGFSTEYTEYAERQRGREAERRRGGEAERRRGGEAERTE
jgi:hypothetical protein